MSGKGKTCIIDDAFVYRRRHDGGIVTFRASSRRLFQGVQYIARIVRIELTGHDRTGQRYRVYKKRARGCRFGGGTAKGEFA
jgi:hypothetical protein